MDLTRRAVLSAGALAVPAWVLGSRAMAAGDAAALLTLVIDAVPVAQAGDAAALGVLDAFLSRGLPIAMMTEPARYRDAASTDAVVGLAERARRDAGLLELVAPVPDVEGRPRYAQMRAAAELRAALTGPDGDGPAVVTLIDRVGLPALDWPAFRSAGFRIILRPDGIATVRAEPIGRGQLRLDGGITLSTVAGAAPLVEQVGSLLATGDRLLAILPLGDLDGPRAGDVAAAIDALAERLEAVVASGEVVMVRPMDHLLQSGEGIQRNVALLVEVDDAPAALQAATALSGMLDAASIPFTLAASPDTLRRVGRVGDCHVWGSTARGSVASKVSSDAACLLVAPSVDVPDDVAARIVVVPSDGADGWTGVRADARLHLAARPWLAGRAWPESPILSDVVLRADVADLATPQRRGAFVRDLTREAQGGGTRFWRVEDLGHHLLATDPLLDRYATARARGLSDPPRPSSQPVGADRDEFMSDARTAWAYIERNTDPATGLCATTVQEGDFGQVNVDAALWDVGSQIQGILAAGAIGIVPADEARDRISLLARNIPAIDTDGLRLPPALFAVDSLETTRPGFDACDLGRFLLALDAAVTAGALTARDSEAVWGAWDIGGAIRGGRLHSHHDGAWFDITESHCTDYILPAFARRGWAVQNVYPEAPAPLVPDEAMTVLATAAAIGAYGTEPTLLEIIESGASEPARLLAQVLFDAQLDWYERTGEMRSVSETPLNFAPWFTYQGLALERTGPDAWVVASTASDPAFRTEEFRRRARLIGAKSAYLWKAAYPHPYSDALVDLVRARCRTEGSGFTVGVFTATGEGMDGYFDINTNGIILTALARILDAS